nr:BON domain-containing protein [uncultured Rhizobium sp.]
MVFKHPQFNETAPEIEVEFPAYAHLEGKVADALASAGGIDASEVTVTVTGTSIALAGRVADAREIARAEEVVRSVEGVTEVRNSLTAEAGSHLT